MQLKIQPKYFVYANPQPDEDFRDAATTLTIKTGDPKTKVNIIYPKGTPKRAGPIQYATYEGEISIQAIIERAEGDNSPLEGTFFLRAIALSH